MLPFVYYSISGIKTYFLIIIPERKVKGNSKHGHKSFVFYLRVFEGKVKDKSAAAELQDSLFPLQRIALWIPHWLTALLTL